jgi:hypothetical protein
MVESSDRRGFEIRLAAMDECLDILSEPRLLSLLPIEDISCLHKHIQDSEHPRYIVKYKQYTMLFVIWRVHAEAGIYEIHVACPKDSIIASRVLTLATMGWVFKDSNLEAKALLTSCPEGKIANMCRKIGFKEIKKQDDLVYFIASQAHNGRIPCPLS